MLYWLMVGFSTHLLTYLSLMQGDGEEGASSSSNNAPATDSQSIPTSKSVTCLSYDLFQGRSDADIAVRKQQQEQEGGGGGDAGEEEEDTGLFYYLGGSASTFLKYIQQELSRPEAKDEGVEHEQIDDLVTQKVCLHLRNRARKADLT